MHKTFLSDTTMSFECRLHTKHSAATHRVFYFTITVFFSFLFAFIVSSLDSTVFFFFAFLPYTIFSSSFIQLYLVACFFSFMPYYLRKLTHGEFIVNWPCMKTIYIFIQRYNSIGPIKCDESIENRKYFTILQLFLSLCFFFSFLFWFIPTNL